MPATHRVVAVAYDGLSTFEFGIVVEAFGVKRPDVPGRWYDFSVCSLERKPLRATGGVTIRASAGLNQLRRADTVVISGWHADKEPPPILVNAIRAAYKRGARVVSICSGVFVLAAAGLLDGRRATTHWRHVDRLTARFPRVIVEPDVLYVDEDRVMTSAGSAAGIDLCLHIIRKDRGAEVANRIARSFVMPPHREGGQSQYIERAIPAVETPNRWSRVVAWVEANLARDLSVEVLARQAGMSPRTFARRFRAELGVTPHQWLLHQRLIKAQRMLETSDASIDRVAEAVGLQTAATMRQHFQRRFRTSPSAYRRRFTVRS